MRLGSNGGSTQGQRLAPYLRLVWPVVLVVIRFMFRDPLSDLIRRIYNAEVAKDDKGFRVALVPANLAAATTGQTNAEVQKRPLDLERVAQAASRAASASSGQGAMGR
jgi:hypothetical protein